MNSKDALREILRPLGLYALTPGSLSGSELYAVGGELDALDSLLQEMELESIPLTASDWGIYEYERLFKFRNGAVRPDARRKALLAMLGGNSTQCSIDAINQTIAGCGADGTVSEIDAGSVQVRFSEHIDSPELLARMKDIIDGILPCHLAVEYYLEYPTWSDWESYFPTFSVFDGLGLSWDGLELYKN